MTEKIMKSLNIINMMSIIKYGEMINEFIKSDYHQKLKLCFDLFDQDGDGFISIIDAFNMLKSLKSTDYYLSRDAAKIINALERKKARNDLIKREKAALEEKTNIIIDK